MGVLQARDEASMAMVGSRLYMVGGIGQDTVEVTRYTPLYFQKERIFLFFCAKLWQTQYHNEQVMDIAVEEEWSSGPTLPDVTARFLLTMNSFLLLSSVLLFVVILFKFSQAQFPFLPPMCPGLVQCQQVQVSS